MKKIKFDKDTSKWLDKHPHAEPILWKCSKCGLYFRPTLGHKCKEDQR